ncbi:MAG: DNA recombination/repair protein RecA, partial [Chloroflexota bacterium]
LDLGVEYEILEKRGSYYRYGEELLGQGRENSKQYLLENPEMMDEVELLIRQEAGLRIPKRFAEEEEAAEAEAEAEVEE